MEQAGITLTPHQQDALDWLVTQVCDGKKLVALRGLAGTGKTTVIPALRAALDAKGIATLVGSPTHRAAMILRKKGINDADTVHSHALTPYFTEDYRRAASWLGEELPSRLGEEAGHDDIDGIPWLIYEAVKPDLARAKNLRRHRGRYKAKRLLTSIGISGKNHFAGFGPKQGQGVLIIDEASMVGRKMLATCQEAFEQIILVGDPGQLSPVKDDAMLAEAEGIDLTEIHRQASDSPIIQLAYKARQGEPFWHNLRFNDPFGSNEIVTDRGAQAKRFLTSPLLVWRNSTRIECTHEIRKALGYDRATLHEGEPLVCRSTSQEDRALGFYNNGLYTITEVSSDDPRLLTVEDALGNAASITAHLEEVDGESIDPRAIPFRFGYCLTAHTAQGGEWSHVYVSLPDLMKYAGMCQSQGKTDDIARWAYTVITRAKEHLCFLAAHAFFPSKETEMPTKTLPDMTAPTLAPLLDHAKPETPTSPLSALGPEPTPDDIPETPLPAAVREAVTPPMSDEVRKLEPLMQGFCAALQGKLNTLWASDLEAQFSKVSREHFKVVDDCLQTTCDLVLKNITRWLTEAQPNEHASYQLANALTNGVALRHDPYTITIRMVSPQGFPVELTIAQSNFDALGTALAQALTVLGAAEFKPA